jgi:predicted RNA-binding protein with PUA-like domain
MTKNSKAKPKNSQRHWLLKSEPHVFSIDDLAAAANQTTYWDGVRNYQARNTLRDQMQLDDLVLFYHSNCDEPAIAGLAKVVRTGYPDFTAWDENDVHYDPKTDPDNPRWYMVDIQFVEKFKQPLTLSGLRSVNGLEHMVLLQKGSRLSVQPVSPAEYAIILKLSKQ